MDVKQKNMGFEIYIFSSLIRKPISFVARKKGILSLV
jgi:hypothetical protein